MKFVVAFNRDRDHYHVPLALEEAGLLESLITDYYVPDRGLMKQFTPKRLKHRTVEGLPSRRVKCSLKALGLNIAQELKPSHERRWETLNTALARKAATVAVSRDADLLLYSHTALEAFADPRLKKTKRGLFVFHPHYKMIGDILQSDCEQAGARATPTISEPETTDEALKRRVDSECCLADYFICASSFTMKSLICSGISRDKIAVVPYGTSTTSVTPRRERASTTKFLFVGQGVQRKGVHHLLEAWRRANLQGATLRLVCSRIDPAYIHLADQSSVELSQSVSKAELQNLFNSAHIFVMPSLVEGFGLVYLEALAAGCYVMFTPNTGVPDINLPNTFGTQVTPGNVDELESALHAAHKLRTSNAIDHDSIQGFAKQLSWQHFRSALVQEVTRLRA